MARNLDPAIVKHQIDNLFVQFPELLEDEVFRADVLEGQTDLKEWMRAIERKRQDAVALAEGLKFTIANLSERKKRFDRRDEAMRTLIFKMMETAHEKKFELPEATISIRAGVQSVIITDETLIPKKFQRVTIEPNKIAIKEELKAGKKVAGATLSNATDVLNIRVS